MKKLFYSSLIGIGAALLSACGPVYRTTYTFVAPDTWRGRQCANKCLQARSHCRSHCMHEHELCRTRADVMNVANQALYHHYHKHDHHHGRHGWPAMGWGAAPSANYSNCQGDCGCENDYRVCYQNCGGQVHAHTYCVSGCDKIKNQARPMGVGTRWK